MTDISIIGTGCLIVALVIAAGIVVRLRRKLLEADGLIAGLQCRRTNLEDELRELSESYINACAQLGQHADEARARQAQRIAAGKKGRATQTARALAKKAGL